MNDPEGIRYPTEAKHGPGNAGIIRLPGFHDSRGSLTVAEQLHDVPFSIERAFWIYGVPSGRGRGGHAHRNLTQLLIAVHGSLTVILDDGESSTAYLLDNPSEGLLVPPGTWNILENFSAGAVCLVLVSGHYDEGEYIREYDDFRAFRAKHP